MQRAIARSAGRWASFKIANAARSSDEPEAALAGVILRDLNLIGAHPDEALGPRKQDGHQPEQGEHPRRGFRYSPRRR